MVGYKAIINSYVPALNIGPPKELFGAGTYRVLPNLTWP